MKRILTITFLNFFISGGLTLTIPLLLLERNVNIIEIGLVISTLPLVFLITRLLIAAIADLKGWSRFYLLLNWPASLLATLLYLSANSTPIFLLGKIAEACKESAYWAVNRTAIFSLAPNREEKEATKNTAVIFLATAIGSAIAGLGIYTLGFSVTLGIFIAASAAIGIPSAALWRAGQNFKPKNDVQTREFLGSRNYGRKFWVVSIALLFFSLAYYSLLNLLLPVFMAQRLGYNYLTIGLFYMLFNAIAGIITLGTLRFQLGTKRAFLQSSIAFFATAFLACSNLYFPALFLALAAAEGLGMGFFEAIIAKATKNRSRVSFDIGLLHVPMRFAEFISLLYAGIAVEAVGYASIFIFSGIFFAIFSAIALRLIKNNEWLSDQNCNYNSKLLSCVTS
ncbi:MAG: MFS transporter [Candidatus Bathyarchaeota archaeon]|nr:MFS transporter [Candidatus Bathyarchaeota archaeon]